MMNVREAVGVAFKSFTELFPDQAKDPRLEEIDREGKAWKVTISVKNPDFQDEIAAKKALPSLILGERVGEVSTRKYKSILVDANTGDLVSVRNV